MLDRDDVNVHHYDVNTRRPIDDSRMKNVSERIRWWRV
jgi:hypothetical protein